MKPALFILLLLISNFDTRAQDDLQIKHPKTYQAVLKTISNLPETKEFLKMAKSSRPMVYVDGPSTTWNNYWWVKVGTGNFDLLRTNFDFLVDPKTLKVYYLDTFAETEEDIGMQKISLQQWRKWRTISAWKKAHRYRNGILLQ